MQNVTTRERGDFTMKHRTQERIERQEQLIKELLGKLNKLDHGEEGEEERREKTPQLQEELKKVRGGL